MVFSPRPIPIGGDVVLDYVPVVLGYTHAVSCVENSRGPQHSEQIRRSPTRKAIPEPAGREAFEFRHSSLPHFRTHRLPYIQPYVSSIVRTQWCKHGESSKSIIKITRCGKYDTRGMNCCNSLKVP